MGAASWGTDGAGTVQKQMDLGGRYMGCEGSVTPGPVKASGCEVRGRQVPSVRCDPPGISGLKQQPGFRCAVWTWRGVGPTVRTEEWGWGYGQLLGAAGLTEHPLRGGDIVVACGGEIELNDFYLRAALGPLSSQDTS